MLVVVDLAALPAVVVVHTVVERGEVGAVVSRQKFKF